MMNLGTKKCQVFLSHSGLDAHRATELAATLERRFADLGIPIEVFNTSEPEHRHKDLQELLTTGENWRIRADQYESELRTYLAENMEKSTAFISLVTPQSLRAASRIIEYEIETARTLAKKKQSPFFFPCVTNGASLRDLPSAAMEFQGVELDEAEGLANLVEAARRAFSK